MTADEWHKLADERSAEIVRLSDENALLSAHYTALIVWLRGQGLLVRHPMCTRPDNTLGPAWVLRRVAAVDGGSCLGWDEEEAVVAVEKAMRGAK